MPRAIWNTRLYGGPFGESTTTRMAGGLGFPPKAEKTETSQCFNSCLWHRLHSTRFETKNQKYLHQQSPPYFGQHFSKNHARLLGVGPRGCWWMTGGRVISLRFRLFGCREKFRHRPQYTACSKVFLHQPCLLNPKHSP